MCNFPTYDSDDFLHVSSYGINITFFKFGTFSPPLTEDIAP